MIQVGRQGSGEEVVGAGHHFLHLLFWLVGLVMVGSVRLVGWVGLFGWFVQ